MVLAECPYCGGEAKEKKVYKPFFHGWVGCPHCHYFITWSRNDRTAIKRWNSLAVILWECDQVHRSGTPRSMDRLKHG